VRRGAETPDPSGSGVVVRVKFRPARGLVASARPVPRAEVPRISRTRAERLARQLALAHWIERAVEGGRVASYGEVARALGLTESRITQVTALLGLSPAVQSACCSGRPGSGSGWRGMRSGNPPTGSLSAVIKWERECYEKLRLIREEQEWLDTLLAEAATWRKSREVHEYVSDVLERLQGHAEADRISKWATWARAHADRFDPLARPTVDPRRESKWEHGCCPW